MGIIAFYPLLCSPSYVRAHTRVRTFNSQHYPRTNGLTTCGFTFNIKQRAHAAIKYGIDSGGMAQRYFYY